MLHLLAVVSGKSSKHWDLLISRLSVTPQFPLVDDNISSQINLCLDRALGDESADHFKALFLLEVKLLAKASETEAVVRTLVSTLNQVHLKSYSFNFSE